MARLATTLLLLLALAVPALAGIELDNETGKMDGIYDAVVMNITKKSATEPLEVEIEGRNCVLRFPDGHKMLRIQQIYDRRYELEVTARDRESGEIWVVRIET